MRVWRTNCSSTSVGSKKKILRRLKTMAKKTVKKGKKLGSVKPLNAWGKPTK